MAYPVTAYNNWDEGDIKDSDRFESYSDAMDYANEQAEELADSGEEIEHLEGAPDFAAEIAIVGTPKAVVVRDSNLM